MVGRARRIARALTGRIRQVHALVIRRALTLEFSTDESFLINIANAISRESEYRKEELNTLPLNDGSAIATAVLSSEHACAKHVECERATGCLICGFRFTLFTKTGML